MKKITILLAALLLSACAAMPSPQTVAYREYIETNKPKAEQGTLLWSEYYDGMYTRAMSARAPAYHLNRLIEMIDTAKKYEKGEISKDDFERARRVAQAGNAADVQAEEEFSRQRRATAAAAFASAMSATANQYQPVPYQIVPPTPMQPVQPLPTIMPATNTVTATWTGRQEMVQTVTYQSGWNCEYNYAGRKFWRVVLTSCPSSVEVR